jgi:membrane fusion protein (multidrug efflux system)
VSRVAPVFDPATRTAEMEIEVPNPGFRLKPGMYSRVQLTIAVRAEAITVPSNAVVLVDGKSGVFVASGAAEDRAEGSRRDAAPGGGDVARTGGSGERESATKASGDARGVSPALTARFVPVQTGIHDGQQVEIVDGVREGARVVTIGATALKDGDRIVAAGGGAGSTR